MRFINWNISYAGDTENKFKYLQTVITKDTCVMLQEVKPHAYEYIKEQLQSEYHLFYSLNYRKPSKFDSDARKLGVLIIIHKSFQVEDSGVIERSPFPDRTMYIDFVHDNKNIKVLALHSLTGCGYYRTKSVQYDSFTEFIDNFQPDIIGIDANEPQIDHYDIKQMQFFDNGPGAKHFFDKIDEISLVDSFVKHNNITVCENGVPLTKSHNIRRKGAVRYDFIFIKNRFEINSMNYYYDDAINAGSDHALLICSLK